MKIIVGIGNPGEAYARTRHNVGFRVADAFAERVGIRVARCRFDSLTGEGTGLGRRLLVLKPQTFVNDSGRAVAEAVRWHRAALEDVLVIVDDFNLPLGRIRINPRGSAGGHNGLQAIIEALGTEDVPRLRVGIGDETGRRDRDFVLSEFTAEQQERVAAVVEEAAEAVGVWVREGIARCMDRFNRRPKPAAAPRQEEETT